MVQLGSNGLPMRKIIALSTLIATTMCLSMAALILRPFDPRGEKVNRLGRLWATIHLRACGITVSVEGLEHMVETPAILMCNHQSTLDIFALLSSLRLPFKWVAKKELFSVPFLGLALRAGRNIAIDREHPRRALKAMGEAALRIREGDNVLIFPEGTWSKTDTLLPFKRGGFSLALRTGAPIVPVGIRGTRRLQPEGCLVPQAKGLIEVRVGRPIPVKAGGQSAKAALMLEVRSHIERLASPEPAG